MLEGQQFEPAGRLAQFVRVAGDFKREDVEAIVDRLMDRLVALDAIDAPRMEAAE